MLRTIRSLDGIAYAAIAFILLVVHPTASTDALGRLNLIYVAPIVAAAVFSSRIPFDLLTSPTWQHCVARLKISSYAMAGLMPFVAWWTINGGTYLLACSILAVYAVIAFLFQLTTAVSLIAAETGAHHLHAFSHRMRLVVMYVPLCSFSALWIVAVLQATFFYVNVLDTLRGLFFSSPLLRYGVFAMVLIWLVLAAVSAVILPLLLSNHLSAYLSATEPADNASYSPFIFEDEES